MVFTLGEDMTEEGVMEEWEWLVVLGEVEVEVDKDDPE